MARPRKSGIDYFPFDTDFFSDNKIRILRARFGADGMMLYIFILCEIYRQEGYFLSWNEDTEFIVADQLGMSHEKVKQVMTFLYGRSLLTKRILATPDTIITSAGIQNRYQLAVEERGRKNQIEVDQNIWLLSSDETRPWLKVSNLSGCSGNNDGYSGNNSSCSHEEVHKVKERKVKESRVKQQLGGAAAVDEDSDLNPVGHYMTHINPGMSQREEGVIQNWLKAGYDPDFLIAAMDEAVMQNARRMSYLAAIVRSCVSEGVTTKAQFIARSKKRQQQIQAYKSSSKNKNDVRGNYTDQGDLSVYAEVAADDPRTLFGGDEENERSEACPW